MSDLTNEPARGRRRGRSWVRVSTGIHRRADAADPHLATLLAWQQLLPPEAAFSALTAARLRGWQLPPLPADLPVDVAMPYGCTAPVRPGLRVTRHRLEARHHGIAGLRVCSTADTILTCAAVLSELDLVVLVESAIRAGDLELIEAWMLTTHHRRGVRRLRAAMRWVAAGAESVPESLFRVLHQVTGHEVRTQHVVRDAHGKFLGRLDLWLVGTRCGQEYDGAQHAEPKQRRADVVRDRGLAQAGWTVHHYSDHDLFRRPEAIIRAADLAVRRNFSPARMRPWWRLFTESAFTRQGQRALLDRHLTAQSRARRARAS